MKVRSIALLSAVGMSLTSLSVYSLSSQGPDGRGEGWSRDAIVAEAETTGNNETNGENGGASAEFTAGSTLMVEGRLGHAKLARDGRGETFVMLEVTGTEQGQARSRAPVSLSLVIDRSGSMRGARLDNAIRGALGAVDHLRDGDQVSVVAFDTRTSVIVEPTVLSSGTRRRVEDEIRRISLGGDTCISCGIEEGMALLDRPGDFTTRMLLLSDGDANNGVRDIPGFRRIAQRARDRGVAVTTVGVDVEYNERILSAIAQESNGRHYFVANESGLERVFEQEALATTSTVANGAEASIELGQGVELDRVFDRSFRRVGNRVVVPLGSFSQGETKTVLMKVRVPSSRDGVVPVAHVDLAYRDLIEDRPSTCAGRLAALVTDPRDASPLDPGVEGRVERTETAAVLKEANALVAQGQFDAAKRKVDDRAQALASAATRAKAAAPEPRRLAVDKDFERQSAALDEAAQGFATPPSPANPFGGSPKPTRQSQETVKRNEANALDMAF